MPKVGLVGLVDMDGTLCDYEGTMARDLAALRAPGEPPATGDEPWLRARESAIRRQPGWWRGLPRFQLGFDVLAELQALHFEVHVLTKGPASAPNSWTEKLEWCQQHLPGVPVTITMDKGLVYGKVLVDDWPPYVERWLAWRPRGLVILPAHPHNEGFSHRNAIRYTGHNLDEVRAALHRLVAD
jgi:5'(3')-deoxyribonucleotidase